LALALDATTLGARFVVVVVSVLSRGCAIPVAWTVVLAQQSQPWRTAWLRMLRQLWPAVPPTMKVVVLADRGRSARWLVRRIVRLGWHPLLRVNAGGTFRPDGQPHSQPLSTVVPQPGTRWRGHGAAFPRNRQLACTLLAFYYLRKAESCQAISICPQLVLARPISYPSVSVVPAKNPVSYNAGDFSSPSEERNERWRV
jgi:hypothetical protein